MMRWFAALLAIAWWAIAAPAGAIEIRVVTTPSGVTAWYVHEPALPIIAVDIAFRHGGAAQDPPHREGLAYMMSGLLDEGAGELDSQEFQGRLQDLAVELSADTGLDELRVRFRTLSANRDAAFDLLGLALGQPRFDPEAVERIRRQILSAQRQRAEDPEWLADETWYARAFPDHPYGRPDQGSASSIAAITVEDLRRFARQRLARDVAVIGAIGDVPPAAFAALLERALGGISASAATVDVPETRPIPGGVIVTRKRVPQSVVRFGLPGVKRADPDFYAAYVMNQILGGGSFTSRLYQEVREKRGLAYSVYTFLNTLDHAGLYLGGAATANERVAETLSVIRAELSRLAESGVGAEELAATKDYLIDGYALNLTSNSDIARALTAIQLDGLGVDYMSRRAALLGAVTAADIRRVARRLLREAEPLVVVVGDPQGIEDTD